MFRFTVTILIYLHQSWHRKIIMEMFEVLYDVNFFKVFIFFTLILDLNSLNLICHGNERELNIFTHGKK